MELRIEDLPDLIGADSRTIVEIGANDGEDTERFLRHFPKARVVCFEPDPRATAKWRYRIGRRAEFYHMALSDEIGTEEFFQSGGEPPNCKREDWRDWDKSGSLCRPTGHLDYSPWCKFDHTITVVTSTLDYMLPRDKAPVIDMIWMDVQGAEAKVLRGAQGTLPRVRWLYTECHARPLYDGQPTLEEIAALLPGFDIFQTYTDNILFRNREIA